MQEGAPRETNIETLRDTFEKDSIVTRERELIAEDPELQALYASVIEQCDFDRLKEKSSGQVTQLSERYFGIPQDSPSPEEIRKQSLKEEKLKEFEAFVESLTPIRADKNDFDEYQSPKRTGQAQSYGAQDILCHAEQFVYGSFAEIGHLMSQGKDRHELDKDDIAPRLQIIMNDIVNVAARTEPGTSCMRKYLVNMFDYENGKKILALYLASVFDTPEQAQSLISSAGGHPFYAQRWDDEGNGDLLVYKDKAFAPTSREEWLAQKQYEEEVSRQFVDRMKEILKDTGIEAPLSIEIRVKDSAKQVRQQAPE